MVGEDIVGAVVDAVTDAALDGVGQVAGEAVADGASSRKIHPLFRVLWCLLVIVAIGALILAIW